MWNFHNFHAFQCKHYCKCILEGAKESKIFIVVSLFDLDEQKKKQLSIFLLYNNNNNNNLENNYYKLSD